MKSLALVTISALIHRPRFCPPTFPTLPPLPLGTVLPCARERSGTRKTPNFIQNRDPHRAPTLVATTLSAEAHAALTRSSYNIATPYCFIIASEDKGDQVLARSRVVGQLEPVPLALSHRAVAEVKNHHGEKAGAHGVRADDRHSGPAS